MDLTAPAVYNDPVLNIYRRTLMFMAVVCVLCPTPRVFGEEGGQAAVSWMNQAFESWLRQDVLGGLQRVDYGWEFGDDLEPEVYFETVQPLYQSAQRIDTVFVQPRFSYQEDHRDLYNLGLGYRRYHEPWNALTGVNVFGDFQNSHDHGRLGIGTEWLSPTLDLRFNSYIGLTPSRQVGLPDAGPVFEKVADGLDIEAGFPIPYVPGVRVYGGGGILFLEKSKNLYTWKGRLELRPWKWFSVNVIVTDDNRSDAEWRVDLRFHPAELSGPAVPFGRPSTEIPDARDRALDRVERESRIFTEKFGEGLTFLVAKA